MKKALPPLPYVVVTEQYMKPAGLSSGQMAKRLGVTTSLFSRFINDKAKVSVELALRLGVVTGTTPEYWIDMQTAVDLYRLRNDRTVINKINGLKPLVVGEP